MIKGYTTRKYFVQLLICFHIENVEIENINVIEDINSDSNLEITFKIDKDNIIVLKKILARKMHGLRGENYAKAKEIRHTLVSEYFDRIKKGCND